jgi:hypothetical protein
MDRILPDEASIEGGTEVSILGSGFGEVPIVLFGDALAPEVSVVSSQLLRVKVPAHPAGVVDVSLIDTQGNTALLPSAFEYRSLFRIDSIVPSSGPREGGTMVTIAGRGFTSETRVLLDGMVVPEVVVESDMLIRFKVPPYPQYLREDKKVNVRVASPTRGSAALVEGYTYKALPLLQFTSILPNRDNPEGGKRATLQGVGFTPDTAVLFGDPVAEDWEMASVTFVSSGMLTVTVPPHAPGRVALRIVDPNGRTHTQPDAFTYNPPPALSLAAVAPAQGPAEGGIQLTVTGTGFDETTQVLFGGTLGTGVKVLGGTVLSVTLPPHTEGDVDVEVVRGNGDRARWASPFKVLPLFDPAPPRLVSAIALSNTEVLVQYSKPMDALAAANTAHYEISNPNGSVLIVTGAAVLDLELTRVRLTTLSQAQIAYDLRVTDVNDKNAIPPEGPMQAGFNGLPSSGTPWDSDGDGLSDRDEMLGWTVTLTQSNGEAFTRTVTSDPFKTDTDLDGLSDLVENYSATDPRARDTDSDSLSDLVEQKVHASSPTKQDTDEDGLPDAQELVLKTSPILADTDGDKWNDSEELYHRNRNPLIADIPILQIDIGEMRLELDQRYSYTDSEGRSQSKTESSSAELAQSKEKSRTKTDATSNSSTHEWNVELSAEVELGGESLFGGLTMSATAGYGGSVTSEHSSSLEESSTQSVSETYQQGVERASSFDATSEVTREVAGAQMSVAVTLSGGGDLAFSVENLEITALQLNPNGRGTFLPVATLVPPARGDGSSPSYHIGPLVPPKGPIIFQNKDIFPNLAEQLLKNPHGLMFRVANYEMADEAGRNFAFASQDINERTALIVIDYGDGKVERYRVAVAGGFDLVTGKPVFRKMGYVLDDILGIKKPADVTREDPILTGAPTAEQLSSFGMRMKNGKRALARLRGVQTNLVNPKDDPRFWVVFATDTSINTHVHFDEILVKPGATYNFTFTEDRDKDRLFARDEWLAGSSDLDPDSDDDSLTDYKEVQEGVAITVKKINPTTRRLEAKTYMTYSNPRAKDSDGDGYSDVSEYNRKLPDGRTAAPTDPSQRDTDEDGLSDETELKGYVVYRFKDDFPMSVHSDPLNQDTDGDGLTDLVELRLGSNPEVFDSDTVLDDDGDTLVNADEKIGYDITVNGATRRVFSNPVIVDTDRDGLTDTFEREKGLDPGAADTDGDEARDWDELYTHGTKTNVSDTDGDGLWDGHEVSIHKTKPTYFDTDGEGLSDGQEVFGWTYSYRTMDGGTVETRVTSNPLKDNSDTDGWNDATEKEKGTNPRSWDTDGDGTSDDVEASTFADLFGGVRDPRTPDQLIKINHHKSYTGDDCDGTGDGEFYWEFKVKIDGKEAVFSHGEKVGLSTGDTGYYNQSKTFVKKPWEDFAVFGWLTEDDDGADYHYFLPDWRDPQNPHGWGVIGREGFNLVYNHAPECHIEITVEVRPL